MKKLLLFAAVAAFTTGTMVSCGKSSKGKLDNAWNIDAYEDMTTTTTGGSTSTTTQSFSGSVVTNTTVSGGTTTTTTGTVNEAVWTIKKDGTWERILSFTFKNGTVTNTTTVTESGKWDFFTGVGEFKKNERIAFSTLSSQTVSTMAITASNTSTTTTTNTYLDGENSEIYVIKESSKKALSLEAQGGATDSTTSGGTTTSSSSTNKKVITLSV